MFGLKLKRSKCQAPNDLFGAPCSLPASCFAAQVHGPVAPTARFLQIGFYSHQGRQPRRRGTRDMGVHSRNDVVSAHSLSSPTYLPKHTSLPLPRLSLPPGGLFLTAGPLTSTLNHHWVPSQGSRDKPSTVRPGGTLGLLQSISVAWEEGCLGAKTSE